LTVSRAILVAIAALALAARMVVPAGWMPSYDAGRITITLCTELGKTQAWIDSDGRIHKEAPASNGSADGSCAFAGLGSVADLPVASAPAPLRPIPTNDPVTTSSVSVGQGLPAPPPPSTGPPAILI
jgi:hypothetical protein